MNFCFWIHCTIISRGPKLWVRKLGRAGEKEKKKNGLGQKRILLMERDSQSVGQREVQGVRTPRAPLGTDRLFNKALSRAEEKRLRCLRGKLGRVAGLRIGGGNGNPLQYSCLGNPMDRVAWRATFCGIARVGHNLATKAPQLDLKLD